MGKHDQKVLESRLRRTADRRGFKLVKSRRRDTAAYDFGLYALLCHDTGGTPHPHGIAGSPYTLTLAEVEEWLAR